MSDQYADGYDQGWNDAADFIERHPHGMPQSALRGAEDSPADNDYERGKQEGWRDRMKQEGWPITRDEALD